MDNFQKIVASRTNNHVKAIGIQCEDKFIVKEPERSQKTGDQNKSRPEASSCLHSKNFSCEKRVNSHLSP